MRLASEFTTEFTSGKGIRKRKGREIVKRDLKKKLQDADNGIITYNLGGSNSDFFGLIWWAVPLFGC